MNKKLILYCCINVFKISPTFLLPVFKDTNKNLYYAQCSKNNKIVGFEEIDIEQYELNSKMYFPDSEQHYSIGTNTVFSVDYNGGFFWGSYNEIVSFFQKHIELFDNRFKQYMADFIKINSTTVTNESEELVVLNKPKDIRVIVETSHRYKPLTGMVYPKFSFRKTRYNNEFMIRAIKNSNSISIIDEKYNEKYIDMVQAMFKSPPVYCLWSDNLIKAFVNTEKLYGILSFNKHFPKSLFRNYNDWKRFILPKEVQNNQHEGFSVHYLLIQSIPNTKQSFMVVAQNYNSHENHYLVYNKKVEANEFCKFSEYLAKDLDQKICYIIDKESMDCSFVEDRRIISMIERGKINIIYPSSKDKRINLNRRVLRDF